MTTLIRSSHSLTMASSARPSTLRRNKGVLGVIGVALRTVRFRRIASAAHIYSMGDQFQVLRPDASRIEATSSANVIPFETCGRPAEKKVMSEHRIHANAELAIAVLVYTPDPQGAAVSPARIDVSPEAFGWSKARFIGAASILVGHLQLILPGVVQPGVDASRLPSIVQGWC